MENAIFNVRHRSKRKPEPLPSEIKTYDPIWPLLSKRWLRVKSRKSA
ncbi:hypothetical protein [Cedecea sp. P7760]|nr:hypothetical protein [Cedecea sp. P7760]